MNRRRENACFRRFQQSGDPLLLARVFDATAPELLRVAGHLANGDPELCQDALQATFLTAIEQADRYDPERDVRPWLLGILANHVRKERRKVLRARGTELADVALAATDSPVAAASAAEFGAEAGAAMKKLPSPFREAIVLHLQHGLTAAEIGEALGRPAGTVRTQIVRGMDRLRALLPAGFTAVALGILVSPGAVLAAVRREVLATLPVPAVVSSSLVLSSGWRLYAMIAAGVTVLLSVVIPLLWSSDPTPPDPGAAAGTTAASDGDAARPAPARELIASVDPVGPPAHAVSLPSRPPQGGSGCAVEFEVVHKQGGAPAMDVPIGIRLDGHMKQWRTDAAGKLAIELPWPGLHEAYVLGTNARTMLSWPEFVQRPRDPEKVRLEIDPGMTLDVRVLDAAGAPVAGAIVESSHGFQIGQMLTALGRTDHDGRFVRRDVGTRGQVRAWANGHLPSRIADARGEVGSIQKIELRLPGVGLAARGVVRDELGQPLAQAELALVQLQARPLQPQFFVSADDGSFEITSLHAGRHALVGLHTADGLRRGQLRFEHDGGEAPQLELRLTRGARIEGRLTDIQGNALANVNLVARDRPEAVHNLPFLETWTTSADDGTFALTGMVAGGYELECDHVETKRIELGEGEVATWNPIRVPLQSIGVRLLDDAGDPLVGWQVSVIPPGSDFTSGGTLTGEDGRLRDLETFPWQYPQGSHCRFAIFKKLGKRDEWDDFSRLPSLITPPLAVGIEHEIRVPKHARAMHRVTGTIVDHTGAAVGDARVEIVGAPGRASGRNVTVTTTAGTGEFEFDELPPGRYHGSVRSAGRPTLRLPPLDVRGPDVVSYGRVELPDLGVVVGTIAAPATADTRGLRLQIVGTSGATYELRRQPGGSWRSPAVFRGSYELRGWTDSAKVAPRQVDLDGAELAVELTLEPHASTRVVVQLPADHPRNGSGWAGTLAVQQQGRSTAEHRLERTFRGVFQDRMEFLVQLPPGPQSLRIRAWNGRTGNAALDVPPGGGGSVVVPIE